MIARALTLAGGLTGALTLSQFPEYSQQYAQRLGGAVNELSRVVADFDADAAEAGLNRQAALAALAQGDSLTRARAGTMARTITRHERLASDLAALQDAGPFERAYQVARLTDGEIAKSAWQAYKPAVPANFTGMIFAALGFAIGLMIMSACFRLFRMVFRRRGPRTT